MHLSRPASPPHDPCVPLVENPCHRALYKAAREGVRGCYWGSKGGVGKVQPKGLDNRLKDLNWLLVHGMLPVREVLYCHKMARNKSGTVHMPRQCGQKMGRCFDLVLFKFVL